MTRTRRPAASNPAPRRAALGAFLAALAAPLLPANAARLRVVGYLSGGQDADFLVKPLAELGYGVGRDLRFEMRVATTPAEIAPRAAELVALNPDALLAFQGHRVKALAAATRTIPIVCGGVPDPIGLGLAQSLRRPGGNVTGLSWGIPETAQLMIGVLRALLPKLQKAATLYPPGLPAAQGGGSLRVAARAAGIEWAFVPIADIADAERTIPRLGVGAINLAPIPDNALVRKVIEIATRLRIVTVAEPADGGLMTVGLDHGDPNGRIARVLDKVLRGVNPAEIPFELPDRTVFIFNRTVARAMGIELPPELRLRVTEFVD